MVNKKKKRDRLPFRLNIIFFVVFILFAGLIIQLGVVQILEGESYQAEIDRTVNDISKSPVPRVKVYDRNGKTVVDNKSLHSTTNKTPTQVHAEDKLQLAEKLAVYMRMNDKELDKVTEQNKKEYRDLKNTDEEMSRLTKKKKKELDD